jgi:hypothetical protein
MQPPVLAVLEAGVVVVAVVVEKREPMWGTVQAEHSPQLWDESRHHPLM